MLRRIVAVLARDTRSSMRDYMILYSVLAPVVLAFVLGILVPAMGGASINLVVPADIGAGMIEGLRAYGKVEVVRDAAAVEARVLAWDDAAGIVARAGSYEVILEGNESHDLAQLPGAILAEILGAGGVSIAQRDLGRAEPPLRSFVASFMPLLGMMLGGLVIGFNVIEDKEGDMTAALGTTPLGRAEYLAGRSILAFVVAILIAVASLIVMGAWPFHLGQIALITLTGTILAVVVGLCVGGVASSQIEGIGVLKLAALPFMIVPVLAWALPDRWHPALYWMPTYWVTMAYRASFAGGAAGGPWSDVARPMVIGLGISLIVLAGTYRWISKRLALRG
jgi:ABC-2 type transport system permease protein